jgi:hypothetical protein
MTTPGNDFQDRVYELTLALIQKHDEKVKENEEHNELAELDDYRRWLALNHPELSQKFEQRTASDWEEAAKQVAMIETIAYGILWALDTYGPS